jgi:hypothetical protein
VALIAVGLPVAWNLHVARQHKLRDEAIAAARAAEDADELTTAERFAMERLVNERRAARGAPPYQYRQRPPAERSYLGALWDRAAADFREQSAEKAVAVT